MMKILVSSVVLSLAASAIAQSTTTFTSPDGYENRNGGYYAYYGLGRYADMRCQYVEGDFLGSIKIIKRLQHRIATGYNMSTSYGMGRTFTSCVLTIGDASSTTLSRTYASNHSGKQTQVFTGAISWGSYTNGTQNNAPWGGKNGEFDYGFSSAYIAQGKKPFLLDFTMKGGKLANNAAWSGSSNRYYMLDGANINTSAVGGVLNGYLPSTRIRCYDPSTTYTSGAYDSFYCGAYGENYSAYNYRNKFYWYHRVYGAAPGGGLITIVGLNNSTSGVNVNALCNNLYVNLAAPNLMVLWKSYGDATSNPSGYSIYYHWTDINDQLLGLKITSQTAWADSKTGQLSLAQACQYTLPATRPVKKLPARNMIYGYSSTSAAANYGPYNYPYANPICRYSAK